MPSEPAYQRFMAVPPMTCHEFIDYILRPHEHPSTVVVCSSREAFLDRLSLSLHTETADSSTHIDGTEQSSPPLLIPTIHQLATSKTVSMAFASSLPHLRAYLASYLPLRSPLDDSALLPPPGQQSPLLAVYGLINLHRATTEYSVQGLSRSLAVAVEAADAWSMRLALVEASEDWESSNLESGPEAAAVTANDPWKEQVPLLSSSVLPSDERLRTGRTVEVRAVIAKWCSFSNP
ncbi:MAG: hypothetical protein LQ349_006765 [Xanthoria aureola]|nr:MAG: hypothetical protein LQ349_006765 [Xanthoria aureola]